MGKQTLLTWIIDFKSAKLIARQQSYEEHSAVNNDNGRMRKCSLCGGIGYIIIVKDEQELNAQLRKDLEKWK